MLITIRLWNINAQKKLVLRWDIPTEQKLGREPGVLNGTQMLRKALNQATTWQTLDPTLKSLKLQASSKSHTRQRLSYAGSQCSKMANSRWFWEKNTRYPQGKCACLHPFPNLSILLPFKFSSYQGNRASFWRIWLWVSAGMQGIMLARTQ